MYNHRHEPNESLLANINISPQRYPRRRSQYLLLDSFNLYSGRCIHEKAGIRSAFSGNRQFSRKPRSVDYKTYEILSMGGVYVIFSGKFFFACTRLSFSWDSNQVNFYGDIEAFFGFYFGKSSWFTVRNFLIKIIDMETPINIVKLCFVARLYLYLLCAEQFHWPIYLFQYFDSCIIWKMLIDSDSNSETSHLS